MGEVALSLVPRGFRRPKTLDMARRVIVIPARRMVLSNHPVGSPASAFNPALLVLGDEIVLYPRIVVGYYKYVSAIAELRIPLTRVLKPCRPREERYHARIVVSPSTRYDMWGAEDPRVTRCLGGLCMVYTGRTLNYFDPETRCCKTLPVMAYTQNASEWVKKAVFVPTSRIRGQLVSDKDAYLVEAGGSMLFFHRPHTVEGFRTLISTVDERDLREAVGRSSVKEVEVGGPILMVEKEEFEEKIGWSAPPVEVEPGRYLTLLHAVDHRLKIYRVFALLLRLGGGLVEAEAVSPTYIMEPREPYETYGDRPYVVFPCGAAKVDDTLVVSYGAADSVVALASFELSELLNLLDKGRLE